MNETSRRDFPSHSILIADDDHDLLQLVRILFENAGYTVSISHNAEGIIELIREQAPQVILLDLQLIGKDGSDICRELKSTPDTAGIPVILISASPHIEATARLCGADGYLSKPFEPADLLQRVGNMIAGKNGS